MSAPPARAATIVDVARAAGVSRQTVTRALHDMPGINPATRERVLAAARELRYHPSRFGRGLVKPAARTLGLVVGDLANPYYGELASAVLGLAAARGWHVVMAEAAGAPGLAAGADAVIAFTGTEFPDPAVGAPNLPVVEVDPPRPHPGRARVVFERTAASAQAVEHLLARGSRRPVVLDVTTPPGGSSRAAAFVAAFRTRGVEPHLAHRTSAFSHLPAGTDAVVAHNDLDGFRLLRELHEARRAVPREVRVVGVDGLAVGDFCTPRLSTLAIDLAEVARAALDLVLELTEAPAGAPPPVRVVEHVFRAREST
ncbi:substrate-binding domain-containing protein [Kineococcus sp. T13]|uniref:substrate-binding domain-containing protein n=1 Tax=Kineococcus vitellinus TaxID=2696565 RepID=UPI001413254B|nr:substrate-binding domain-containing protein [Kineococcus vitellinus]